MRYALGDRRVVMRGNGQWIARNAVLIGDIVLAADVSVWWGAVLRADEDRITIGAATNIQDESVLHVDPGHPLTIGDRVTVGHRAMLHGCRVGDGALIGIGATILNDAVIGRHCIVGAQALITENKRFPERSVVEGVPGKVVREVTDAEVDWLEANARDYVACAQRYRTDLRPQR
jgi:carbonic anhydrase/acetyltransferase-like protein (isoleucine patch superfamily)